MNLAIRQEPMNQNGYTAIDNRVFHLQEYLTPNAFCLLIRVYRMTAGYQQDVRGLSNSMLQAMCNMSKNTVSKAVNELTEAGFLLAQRRARQTTIYSLDFGKIFSFFDDSQNSASQNMTKCFPEYDQVLSQNMGATKENLNKTILNKTKSASTKKKPSHLRLITDDEKPAKKKSEPKFNPVKYPIPEFISSETWEDFVGMRQDIKKPLTERAAKTIVKKLTQFHEDGYDPNESLEYSITGSYPSVYQPKQRIQQKNYQGNNHAINQSANHSNQPKRSQADIYADKLNAELAERFPDEFAAPDGYYEARDCKPV